MGSNPLIWPPFTDYIPQNELEADSMVNLDRLYKIRSTCERLIIRAFTSLIQVIYLSILII